VTVIATGFECADGTSRGSFSTNLIADPDAPTDEVVEVTADRDSVVETTPEQLEAALDEAREFAAEPEAEFEPEPLPAAPIAPAPLAEQVIMPATAAPPPVAPAAAARTAKGFLQRAAAGGGPDVEAAPAAGKFLTRVGVRPLGEVEVPAVRPSPPLVTRSVASGIGPESPSDDISAPAYTRKYMD